MGFKPGQRVWVTVCYADPVVCGCCGQQKYLALKPRVQRVTVIEDFLDVNGNNRVEICVDALVDGRKVSCRTIVAATILYATRSKAMRVAKIQVAAVTFVNKCQHKKLVAAQSNARAANKGER